MRKLRPEESARLSYIVGDMYGEADSELISMLVKRLIDGTPEFPMSTEQWRIEKLMQAAPLKKEMVQELKKILGEVPRAVDRVLFENISAVMTDEEEKVERYATGNGEMLRLSTKEELQKMPASVKFAYQKYRETALHQLNLVNTSMLTSAQQEYINILNVSAGLMNSGQISPYRAIETATRELGERGLIGFYDKAGRRWEPQTAVEMIMRTSGNNVANSTLFTRMDEVGADFITISAHLGARPKCFKDQGQIFSRTGGTGVVEDKNGEKIPYRDWNDSSYGYPDGILGINCRHHAGFFIPGKSTFDRTVYDESENAKRYKQEQKQRAYEREIRKTKRKRDIARALGDEDEAKRLDRKARLESKQLRQFIEENDLRRSRVRERPMNRAVTTHSGDALGGALNDIGTFKTENDPAQDYYGRGIDSHPDEVNRMIEKMEKDGVEVKYRDGNVYAYSPGLRSGEPGQFIISKNASYSAHLHEYQHYLDDKAAGWSGFKVLLDRDEVFRREERAYEVEIKLANELNNKELSDKLKALLKKRKGEIYK